MRRSRDGFFDVLIGIFGAVCLCSMPRRVSNAAGGDTSSVSITRRSVLCSSGARAAAQKIKPHAECDTVRVNWRSIKLLFLSHLAALYLGQTIK